MNGVKKRLVHNNLSNNNITSHGLSLPSSSNAISTSNTMLNSAKPFRNLRSVYGTEAMPITLDSDDESSIDFDNGEQSEGISESAISHTVKLRTRSKTRSQSKLKSKSSSRSKTRSSSDSKLKSKPILKIKSSTKESKKRSLTEQIHDSINEISKRRKHDIIKRESPTLEPINDSLLVKTVNNNSNTQNLSHHHDHTKIDTLSQLKIKTSPLQSQSQSIPSFSKPKVRFSISSSKIQNDHLKNEKQLTLDQINHKPQILNKIEKPIKKGRSLFLKPNPEFEDLKKNVKFDTCCIPCLRTKREPYCDRYKRCNVCKAKHKRCQYSMVAKVDNNPDNLSINNIKSKRLYRLNTPSILASISTSTSTSKPASISKPKVEIQSKPTAKSQRELILERVRDSFERIDELDPSISDKSSNKKNVLKLKDFDNAPSKELRTEGSDVPTRATNIKNQLKFKDHDLKQNENKANDKKESSGKEKGSYSKIKGIIDKLLKPKEKEMTNVKVDKDEEEEEDNEDDDDEDEEDKDDYKSSEKNNIQRIQLKKRISSFTHHFSDDDFSDSEDDEDSDADDESNDESDDSYKESQILNSNSKFKSSDLVYNDKVLAQLQDLDFESKDIKEIFGLDGQRRKRREATKQDYRVGTESDFEDNVYDNNTGDVILSEEEQDRRLLAGQIDDEFIATIDEPTIGPIAFDKSSEDEFSD